MKNLVYTAQKCQRIPASAGMKKASQPNQPPVWDLQQAETGSLADQPSKTLEPIQAIDFTHGIDPVKTVTPSKSVDLPQLSQPGSATGTPTSNTSSTTTGTTAGPMSGIVSQNTETAMALADRLLISTIGLAAAYVPWQSFSQPMSETESLCQGTVFADLVQPDERGQRA